MQEKDLNKKIAIYPGSFDPITKGHLDVLEKAASMFDLVVIAVLKNSSKKPFLPFEDRVELIRESTKHIKNIEVSNFDGLTVDFAKKMNAKFIIRGLRAVSDFEYEMQLSQTNSALDSSICTVFLTTRVDYNFISSSIVKEISSLNGDVSKFVPNCVVEYLHNKNMKGN